MNPGQELLHKPKSGCIEKFSMKSLTSALGTQEATPVRRVICYMSQFKPAHRRQSEKGCKKSLQITRRKQAKVTVYYGMIQKPRRPL